MKITKRQLRRIIKETLESVADDDTDQVDEQDEIAGYVGPLGAGTPAQRKRKRRDAYIANAESFGGAEG